MSHVRAPRLVSPHPGHEVMPCHLRCLVGLKGLDRSRELLELLVGGRGARQGTALADRVSRIDHGRAVHRDVVTVDVLDVVGLDGARVGLFLERVDAHAADDRAVAVT